MTKANEQIALALKAANTCAIEWNPETRRFDLLGPCENLVGANPGAFNNTYAAFFNYIHPDDRERVIQALSHANNAGEVEYIEYRVTPPNGGLRWFGARGEAVVNEQGKVQKIVGVTWDITKRKHAEEQIKQHSRFRNMVSAINQINRDFKHEEDYAQNICDAAVSKGRFSLACLDLKSGNEPILEHITFSARSKQLDIDDAALHSLLINIPQAVTGQITTAQPYICMDMDAEQTPKPLKAIGHHFDINVCAIFQLGDENASAGYFTLCATDKNAFAREDITLLQAISSEIAFACAALKHEQKQISIEKALYETKERAQVTLDSIGEAVITTNSNGAVDYINPAAEALFGWHPYEIIGKSLDAVLILINESTGTPIENPIRQCLKQKRRICTDDCQIVVRRDGTELAVENTATPIRNQEGQIIGAVLVSRDITEMRRITRQITFQNKHDTLTGIHNRSYLTQALDLAIKDLKKSPDSAQWVLYCIDIDQFHIINDTCGHDAGDMFLKQIAKLLRKKLVGQSCLARLGGDEFGILLDNAMDVADALEFAEALRNDIKQSRFECQNKTFALSASIGYTVITANADSATEVLSSADTACHIAKEQGRNRVHRYHEGETISSQRVGEMRWVPRIQQALFENRLELYFQPIKPIAANKGLTMHYEILLRMRTELGSTILPATFLSAAERYHLMPTIDRWVIQTLFSSIQNQHGDTGNIPTPASFSINLSGQSISEDEFLPFVIEEFNKTGIDPRSICFEITENEAITNMSKAQELINSLSDMGCRFALDDFGKGLSSFAYLKDLRVDYLKIDGQFVRDIDQNPINHALVESINYMGHVLGLMTVAEFAESPQIIARLESLGVDYVQGHAIAKPSPLHQHRLATGTTPPPYLSAPEA